MWRVLFVSSHSCSVPSWCFVSVLFTVWFSPCPFPLGMIVLSWNVPRGAPAQRRSSARGGARTCASRRRRDGNASTSTAPLPPAVPPPHPPAPRRRHRRCCFGCCRRSVRGGRQPRPVYERTPDVHGAPPPHPAQVAVRPTKVGTAIMTGIGSRQNPHTP
jgi:hypothetical protein